jgi:RHS repeat-associated protein
MNGKGTNVQYGYDDYGNLVSDPYKEITDISYNHLNLPVKITFGGGGKIEYFYDATGLKLKKKVTDGTTITTTDYMDGFQYTNGKLDFFPHAEGYAKAILSGLGGGTSYTFKYVFSYTDHLGNIRVKYAQNPANGNQIEILEEDHYYPYGLKHNGYNGNHTTWDVTPGGQITLTPVNPFLGDTYKYKYNGKELTDDLGLNFYEMDVRQYDPALARWMAIDPVTHHSQSPYNAFDGNPVFWADPSGADASWSGQAAQDVFGMLKDEINSKPRKTDAELEYDETEENDDIRFRDKKGNVIATYYTDEIDDDVYLPVEDENASNVNLNELLDKYAGMDDIDVIGIGGSWDFTFGMGGGISLEAVYFMEGKNRGNYEFYKTKRQNAGLKGAAGIYGIIANYQGGDGSLGFSDYLGPSFSLSADWKGSMISGASLFWAPRTNDPSGFKSLIDKSQRLWTGYTAGAGYGLGLQWSKQNTTFLNKK